MPLTLELPADVEENLRAGNPDLEREALLTVALDLFRQERVSLAFFARMLGMDRFEASRFLMDRGETAQLPTLDELEADYRYLSERLAAEGR